MTFEEIKQGEETYIMHTYGRFPIALDHGKGATLWDTDGKKYIDLTSGIGVNSLGHDNEALTTAVSEQAHKLMHACNLYYTEPMVQAAKKLVDAAGMGKIFFANSGAEANEGMIKLARKYSFDKYGEGRNKIITLKQSFHGRTVTTLKATGQEKFHQYFFPFTEGFDYAAANDIEAMKRKIDDTTCAVMMECIQGEAGVQPLGADYVKFVRELCDINHALLIIDEVQTGIGRTGKWFAFQRDDLSGGVTPDMVTFAKGVAGGFPMGGMIAFGEKLAALFTPGSHGSTFAGNPLGAAAGLATLGVIEDENLVANAEARGEQLRDGIMATGNPLFVSVRGRGLLDAVELKHPCSHAVMNYCLEHGLIVNAVAPNALRFAPPLIVTAQDVDQALAILKDVPTDLPDD